MFNFADILFDVHRCFECIAVHYVCVVLEESRRGHHPPDSLELVVQKVLVAIWVLEIEFRSSFSGLRTIGLFYFCVCGNVYLQKPG